MRTVAYRLALVVFFTLPFENLFALPGAGRVSRLVGLVVAAFWLLTVVATGQFRRPRLAHFVALLFVLWVGLSLFWTIDVPATRTRFFTYVQLLGLMFVVWESVTSRDRVRVALQAYLLGAWVSVATILYSYATLGLDATTHGRVTTGTFNPNDVGLLLALGVPLAWYLASGDVVVSRRWLRWLNLAYIPVAVVAVALTASRTALAVAFVGMVYIGLSLLRRRPAALVPAVAGLVVLGFVVFPLLPERGLYRLQGTVTDVTSGGFTGRSAVWQEAVDLFLAHPFHGVGAGAFREGATDTGKVAHNFVLALLGEVGVIGLGLFLMLLVLVAVAAWRQPEGRGGLWTTVLVSWLLAASLHNWEYRKQSWFFFGLILASAYVDTSRDADRDRLDPDGGQALAATLPDPPEPASPVGRHR